MTERFFIRLSIFTILSAVMAGIYVYNNGGNFVAFLSIAYIILSIIYSVRFLLDQASTLITSFAKLGFIAILAGSIPGIIVLLIMFIALASGLLVLSVCLGTFNILRELLSALKLDGFF